jgi:signal transduction histidine kinase/ligand-binding sensor protein
MDQAKSKFEEIIGNVDAFQLMLEGAFNDWMGSYDVLLSDTGKYLFSAKNMALRFRPFCQKLRSKKEGDTRCWECDRDAAERVREQRRPDVYQCHSGLTDIAVPIFVENELLATVFCGQVRSMNEVEEIAGQKQIKQLEQELDFAPEELTHLWEKTPRVPSAQIERLVERIVKLVNYVAELGHERLELMKALRRDDQRLRESASIEGIARELSSLAANWDEFWQRVQDVLERVIEVIGARCALILIPAENGIPKNNELVVKAVVNLPKEHFKNRRFSREDEIDRAVLEKDGFALIQYTPDPHPGTVWESVWKTIPAVILTGELSVAIRIRLDDRRVGMLVLFLNDLQDKSNSLPIREERAILTQLAFLIGAAYQNQNELALRRSWLRRVTHQLIAPLHGVQGYAEDAQSRLTRWEKDSRNPIEWTEEQQQRWKDELRRWSKSFDSIVSSAHHASRLAHNLAWVVHDKYAAENMEPAHDVVGLLIKAARDFQGLARERGLRSIFVDKESTSPLNDILCLDINLFRQAVGNLLENAVKYSERGATIFVSGRAFSEYAEIYVLNDHGIRVAEDEVESIFEEGQRTSIARLKHASGTGIGLTVARDIIKLLGGSLIALPSKWTTLGWQTTFVITLPVAENNRTEEIIQ